MAEPHEVRDGHLAGAAAPAVEYGRKSPGLISPGLPCGGARSETRAVRRPRGRTMPAIIVIGTQWGDEGKGKATDQLGDRVDYVVRYSGGNNAGHTVVVGRSEEHTSELQ